MRKIFRMLTLILSLVLIATVAFSVSAISRTKVNLTVLGDSIASGYGLNSMNDCYGNIIAADKGYTLANSAVPGHKTSDLLSLLEDNSTVQKNVVNADVIIISIGGNDLLGMLGNASYNDLLDVILNKENSKLVKNLASTLTTNLNAICKNINELNDEATVIIQTTYNPLYANKEFSSYASTVESFIPLFNSIYNSMENTYSNVYISDVHKAFSTYYTQQNSYDIIQSDGIHPSVKGHALIASTITDTIETLEAKNVIPVVKARTYLLGDSDNSGVVAISDASRIQKFIAKMVDFTTEEDTLRSDADGDGNVTVKDASLIQKYIAKLPVSFPIGEEIEY